MYAIYKILLKAQKIIEKIIEKTNHNYNIPEIVILFFILFSILIMSKIILLQKTNIIITVFFSSLAFICSIINSLQVNFSFLDKTYIIMSLIFLFIINIISINQFILM